jgi:hypothetical protein
MVTFNHCLSCIRTSTNTVFLPFFFILRLNYVLSPIQLNLTLLKPNRYFPVHTRLETVMIGSLNDPLKFNLVDVRCQSVQHNSGSFPRRTKIFTLSVNNWCSQNIYEIAFLVLFLKYFHILVPFHFLLCGVERVSSYLMGVSDGLL